jgi:hypothetical protein
MKRRNQIEEDRPMILRISTPTQECPLRTPAKNKHMSICMSLCCMLYDGRVRRDPEDLPMLQVGKAYSVGWTTV